MPVHQMSASASNAALQAHADHKEYEVPVHQLSANAGKAALLAHHDHKEYQVPDHALSANAGKAALLAHRDTVSAQSKPNPVSAASAANALKAATQAHHDPAMRPTKPEDLQAKGAANALKAASQAHHEAPAPFKYVHPSDDPQVGQLARRNTQAYLAEMDPRAPHEDTVKYANLSYNSNKARESRASEYRAVSDEAYRSAGLAGMSATPSEYSFTPAARQRTNTTSTANKPPVDLMALARKNVDAQMAQRGMSRTASQQTVSTIGAANTGANLAFRDGRERQIESDRQRAAREDDDISARINREMAQFDQQRKRNQNSGVVQSALMEAAKRNARLSMAQMEANRPYSAPNLRDTQRLEDLLNEQKLAARRESPNGAMVDIGGGHYMSQVEIEAVAARRVQPVFDEMDQHVAEINRRKAEVEARRKAEQERKEAESAERRRQREIEKERERNTKEAEKAAKAEAKAKRAAEKAELEKQRREEAEARRVAERERREEAHAAERRRVEEAR
ncbi:MAG: eisosome protein 1, partial [Oxalobacteraceae bacterium]